MKARPTRFIAIVAAGAVLVVVVVLLTVHSSDKGSSSASPTSRTNSTSGSQQGSTTTASIPPTTAAPGVGVTTTTLQPIPLQVKATSGLNLRDGQTMTVTVTADKGSEFFGMDARLCAGGVPILTFYDFTPDPAGHCILHPVSSRSDAFVEAAVAPPHQSGSLIFRVGVGTSRFKTEDLQNMAVSCDPDHPCQLVVRLQYPYGYGFRSFPVTYAR